MIDLPAHCSTNGVDRFFSIILQLVLFNNNGFLAPLKRATMHDLVSFFVPLNSSIISFDTDSKITFSS
jgi:hypothetical protein